MNTKDFMAQRLVDRVRRLLDKERQLPLKVSIMGQTGVGKSSLINALFNTGLNTDPVRRGTEKIEEIVVKGSSGHELYFYDLPGIGESEKADEQYLTKYQQMLIESDIVLWAIHSDSRSFTYDRDALRKIFESLDENLQAELISKITFILTKADLLTPTPWILAKLGNDSIFVPQEATENLLAQKELYFQEAFILPYKDLITSQTYHNGDLDIDFPHLRYDESMVYYSGFLDKGTLATLKKRFPKHEAVFDRLYDNNRIIPCSSRFRFNLDLLMRVIINKLGSEAVTRFSNFYTSGTMSRLLFSEAIKYRNLIVLDEAHKRVIFDLAEPDI